MESPSSARRVRRSQVLAANSNHTTSMSSKITKESEQVTKKKSALLDITNGSPIVGLATGILETPSSSAVSRNSQRKKCFTPGSGEALLRDQVKNLLQMVEEEAEISLGKRPNFFHVQGIVAPTPANTPLMDELLPPVTASPVEDKFIVSQILNKMVYEEKKQEKSSSSSSNITRSLLLDFCDKSESSSSVCSSVFTTYQEDEEEETVIDELCEAVSNINVNGGGHTNSDDEFEGV